MSNYSQILEKFPNIPLFHGTATEAVKAARERESLLITLCAEVTPTIPPSSQAFLNALNENAEFWGLIDTVLPRPVVIFVDSQSRAGQQLHTILPELQFPAMLIADPCEPGPPLCCLNNLDRVDEGYRKAHATLVKRHMRDYNAIDLALAAQDPHRKGISPTSSVAAPCVDAEMEDALGPGIRKSAYSGPVVHDISVRQRPQRTEIDEFLESTEGKSGFTERPITDTTATQRPITGAARLPSATHSTATAVRSARASLLSPTRRGVAATGDSTQRPDATQRRDSAQHPPSRQELLQHANTAPGQPFTTAALAASARHRTRAPPFPEFVCGGIIPEQHPHHQWQHQRLQTLEHRPMPIHPYHRQRVLQTPTTLPTLPLPYQRASVARKPPPAHPYHRRRVQVPLSAPAHPYHRRGLVRPLGTRTVPAVLSHRRRQPPLAALHRGALSPTTTALQVAHQREAAAQAAAVAQAQGILAATGLLAAEQNSGEVRERGLILSPGRHVRPYGMEEEEELEREQRLQVHSPCPFCLGTGSAEFGREYFREIPEYRIIPAFSEFPEYQLISSPQPQPRVRYYPSRSQAARLSWTRPVSGALPAPKSGERLFPESEGQEYIPYPEVDLSMDLNNIWGQRAESPLEGTETLSGKMGFRPPSWTVPTQADTLTARPGVFSGRGATRQPSAVLYRDACVGTDDQDQELDRYLRRIFQNTLPEQLRIAEIPKFGTEPSERIEYPSRDDFGDIVDELRRIRQHYLLHSLLRDPMRRMTREREQQRLLESQLAQMGAEEVGGIGLGEREPLLFARRAGAGAGLSERVGVGAGERIVLRGLGLGMEPVLGRGDAGAGVAGVAGENVEMARPVLLERLAPRMHPRKVYPLMEKPEAVVLEFREILPARGEVPAAPLALAAVGADVEKSAVAAPRAAEARQAPAEAVHPEAAATVTEETEEEEEEISRLSSGSESYEVVDETPLRAEVAERGASAVKEKEESVMPEDEVSLFGWLFGKKKSS